MASSPAVPQRPVRSQNTSQAASDSAMPQVPPRPSRQADRSVSRDREGPLRSPLNASPFANKVPSGDPSVSKALRPPSVDSLPLVGQEGIEYASLQYGNKLSVEGAATPNETRNVAGDLPLHAPKASVPSQGTTTKLSTAAHGHSDSIESRRLSTDLEDSEPLKRTPSARSHGYHRPPSATIERTTSSRAESVHEEDEHGIPTIGVQVPLLSMAGDVQAPSPGASQILQSRRRSAHDLVPPGSYGLHGHGSGPIDKFDMDWYQKHPEELAKEEYGAYGPGMASVRGDYVMSSDDLNRMVRDSGSRGVSAPSAALPPEDYGYSAGPEEVTSRSQTPLHRVKSRTGSTHVDSPLRQTFSPDGAVDHAFESETDDEHHMRPLSRPRSKNDWFRSQDDLHRGLHLHPSEDHAEGYTTPILAEDEVAKDPMGGFLTPAVTSEDARSRELYESHLEYEAQNHPRSRSASRPGSVHSHSGLSRFVSNEHLEASHPHLSKLEEYEPLFKDEADGGKIKKVRTGERVKRMDLARFPSQDIWEDTPDSLRLETEVATPDVEPGAKQSYFETPEAERARRPDLTDSTRRSFLDDVHAKHIDPHAGATVHGGRPPHHRFPSRDIWEDTPDSSYLVTTVSPEEEEAAAAAGEKLGVPTRPMKAQPSVPPRPSRIKPVDPADVVTSTSPEKKSAPSIPERPKPQIPARPQRSSVDEPPPKTKPQIPSSSSSKFAGIKAGFMNDLNSRLKLGPQTSQKSKAEEEPEQEKMPLPDARKGRAKGPVRRNPPAASSAAPPATRQIATGWSISKPWTVWSISEEKELEIGKEEKEDSASASAVEREQVAEKPAEKATDLGEAPSVSPLATNTAGERLERPGAAPRVSSGALAHASNADMDARARTEEQTAKDGLKEHLVSTIGAEGDVPEPIIDQPKSGLAKDAVKALDEDTGAESGAESSQYEPPTDGGRPADEKTEAEGGLAG